MTIERLQQLIKESIQEVLNESCAACSEGAEQCPECALEEASVQALVPFQQMTNKTNTVEDFMKKLVGKKLKDLLDVTSFARLYVLNKYGVGGNPDDKDIQVLVSNLIESATSFINFRKLDPMGKQRDDWEKAAYNTPEYKAFHVKRNAAVKAYFNAQRSGDQSAIDKARKEKDDIMSSDPTLGDYRKMTADRESLVSQFHNTPLTLQDVLPRPDDSEEDKKRWKYVKKAFDDLKNSVKKQDTNDEPGRGPEYRVRSDEPEPFGYDKGEPEEFREWLKEAKTDPAVQLVLKEYLSHKDKQKTNNILLNLYQNKTN